MIYEAGKRMLAHQNMAPAQWKQFHIRYTIYFMELVADLSWLTRRSQPHMPPTANTPI